MKIKSKNGYNIEYDEYINGNEEVVIIAMHGFAGDKSSNCIKKLQQATTNLNVGLITFDWPSHGQSEVDSNYLTIDNCLGDLETIYDYIKQKNPNAKVIAFSTSFGGYMTLLYNKIHPNNLDGIILRAPAIKMYDILMNNILDERMLESLKMNGYFDFGFERIMRIRNQFIIDLKNNSVVDLYKNNKFNNIDIIHGTNDKTVPIIDSMLFCKEHNLVLHEIEGANHRFDIPGQVEEVVDIARNIIMKKYLEKNNTLEK